MKSAAVLVDAGYVLKNLYRLLGRVQATAEDVYKFCVACIDAKEEDLLRIYYYDCPPFDKSVQHPVTGERIDFGASDMAGERKLLLQSLAIKEKIACRYGTLKFRGWEPTAGGQQKLQNQKKLSPSDLSPVFDQKQVDMKIGLDVAWLSSNHIVDKIILATADTDFIPAMKFARQSGVSIVLAQMQKTPIHHELLEHSDEHRVVPFPPVKSRGRKPPRPDNNRGRHSKSPGAGASQPK